MMKQKIGIAVAGRHPGYRIFARINWAGPDPEDYNKAAVSLDNHYVGVRLMPEGDVYEYVICNFVSNEGRQEAFRIVMQLPHSYVVLDSEGYPVHPTSVLEEVRAVLENNRVLELTGSAYRLSPRMATADFPEAEIAAVVDRYTIKPAWNPFIFMVSADSHPYYVDAQSSEIPIKLNALLHCGNLREASMVFFGRFQESAKPNYVFTPEELKWEPMVRVCVRCRDGAVKEEILTNVPRIFDSSHYGYDPAAFVPCACSISVPDVLHAYRTGTPLRDAAGLRFVLNVGKSTVEIEFNPQLVEKVFYVRVARADRLEVPAFGVSSLLTNIERPSDTSTAAYTAVKETGYVVKGPAIQALENYLRSPLGASSFRSKAPDFEITEVALIGEIIRVSVRYVKPAEKHAPELKPETPVREASPEVKLLLSGLAKDASGPRYVSVSYIDQAMNVNLHLSQLVQFVPESGSDMVRAEMKVPSVLLGKSPVEVMLGDSPKVISVATESNGVLYANFCNGIRRSGLSRYLDLFAFRYTNITPGYKVARIISFFVLILMLLLIGFFLGYIAEDAFGKLRTELTEDVSVVAEEIGQRFEAVPSDNPHPAIQIFDDGHGPEM